MDLINVYFVFIILALSLIFTIITFIYKGMWWWAIVSGLLWIIFGIGSIIYPEVFYFQRMLAVVFIVIGIAMFFTPAWFKRRDNKTIAEQNGEEDETAAYLREREEYERPIQKLRTLGRRKKPYDRT